MLKPTSVLYKRVRKLLPEILNGTLLSIDPSCGSGSSMPAWAFYSAAKLLSSDVILLSLDEELPHRLASLHAQLRGTGKCEPTVCVYEEIPPVRFHANGRTSAGGQSSLLKAVGVVMAAADAQHYIGLRPSVWRRLAGSGYVKSDINDARMMGQIIIEIAQHIAENDPPGRKKKNVIRSTRNKKAPKSEA